MNLFFQLINRNNELTNDDDDNDDDKNFFFFLPIDSGNIEVKIEKKRMERKKVPWLLYSLWC